MSSDGSEQIVVQDNAQGGRDDIDNEGGADDNEQQDDASSAEREYVVNLQGVRNNIEREVVADGDEQQDDASSNEQEGVQGREPEGVQDYLGDMDDDEIFALFEQDIREFNRERAEEERMRRRRSLRSYQRQLDIERAEREREELREQRRREHEEREAEERERALHLLEWNDEHLHRVLHQFEQVRADFIGTVVLLQQQLQPRDQDSRAEFDMHLTHEIAPLLLTFGCSDSNDANLISRIIRVDEGYPRVQVMTFRGMLGRDAYTFNVDDANHDGADITWLNEFRGFVRLDTVEDSFAFNIFSEFVRRPRMHWSYHLLRNGDDWDPGDNWDPFDDE